MATHGLRSPDLGNVALSTNQ